MEPSSEPRPERLSRSESSSTISCTFLLVDRVLIIELLAFCSAGPLLRVGLVALLALDTKCFGASGGLLAAGWNSMIGRKRCSQLYCLAKANPRSKGIQVPIPEDDQHKAMA